MNLEKLRKATELMREALAELDPSTEHQGASGGCGADEPQTEMTAPLASVMGVNDCPASDKWNCKYCRQVRTCEENRRIMAAPPVRIKVGREDWERVEELLRTGRPIPTGGTLWLNTPPESVEARLARRRREHDLALGRVESFHWDCGEMSTTLVPYPPRAEDPEVKLLNDLLRDHKGDVYNFINLKTDVTGAYARDERTICSGTEDYYTQTKLGFLNQMRIARGLPRIAVVMEKQTILRFDLYEPDVSQSAENGEKTAQ